MNGSFAEMVDEAARELGLNDYQLSAAIGLMSNKRVYHPKQVGRLRRGEVRHPDPEVVERLVGVLHLDPSEAFAAARVLPHGFKPEHFRKLEFFVSSGKQDSPEQHDSVVVALHAERRRHDRRHPRTAPVLPGINPGQRRPRRLEVVAA